MENLPVTTQVLNEVHSSEPQVFFYSYINFFKLLCNNQSLYVYIYLYVFISLSQINL